MSKIYEALQHASREKMGSEKLPEVLLPMEHISHSLGLELEEEMLSLYKSIDVFLPNRQNRVIQFIGSRVGEGTSTIIREFARVASLKIGHSVLLLDADRYQPTQNHYFSLKSDHGWIEALKTGRKLDDTIYQVSDSKLFVSPSYNTSTYTPEIFNSPTFDDFFGRMQSQFELILIDSAPLTISPDCLAIAPRADGVVLVLEAERTRWQMARNVKESIERVGGQLLGVVFNKRRYYLPKYIYERI